MTVMHQETGPQRKSAWIPWVFVGGMGLVVVVNAIMITFAVSTFSGLTVEKPYERGIAYNRVMDAQAKQDALGWQFGTDFTATDSPLTGRLMLTVRDRDGAPLDGLVFDGQMVRPVEMIAGVPVFLEGAGDGRYVARVDLPKPGQWDLKLHAVRGDDTFTLIERLDVR